MIFMVDKWNFSDNSTSGEDFLLPKLIKYDLYQKCPAHLHLKWNTAFVWTCCSTWDGVWRVSPPAQWRGVLPVWAGRWLRCHDSPDNSAAEGFSAAHAGWYRSAPPAVPSSAHQAYLHTMSIKVNLQSTELHVLHMPTSHACLNLCQALRYVDSDTVWLTVMNNNRQKCILQQWQYVCITDLEENVSGIFAHPRAPGWSPYYSLYPLHLERNHFCGTSSTYAKYQRPCLHLDLKHALGNQVTSGQPRHIAVYTCIYHEYLKGVQLTTCAHILLSTSLTLKVNGPHTQLY